MPYKDIEDQRKCWRRWYYINKKKAYKAIRTRRMNIKQWLYEYKSKRGCGRCPENFPPCLEFHHKGGSKEDKRMEISRMLQWGHSKEEILKEIAKCELLCSNCHRKEHHGFFEVT